MTIIERTWTQFPGKPFLQEALIEHLPHWLEGNDLRLARQFFKRASVSSRHFALPPGEMLVRGRSFAQKNSLYQSTLRREICALTAQIKESTTAAERSCIDMLVTVSCTGFQIPAMDALIIQELNLPLGLRRLNLTQHGCAGGAASLALAHEWLSTRPDRRALVVCAEYCSLTFQPDDTSAENLVSAALFGDGAAAVLLSGPDAAPAPSMTRPVRMRDTFREFFPRTEHFMGFEVNDAGLKIKLSQDVVPFSRSQLPLLFARACDKWCVPSAAAFETGAVHPGGRRILEILEDDVGLCTAVTRSSWECLDRYGNLSSVSVLCSLDRLLERRAAERPGALGLLSAFGPGFGAELSLLEIAA